MQSFSELYAKQPGATQQFIQALQKGRLHHAYLITAAANEATQSMGRALTFALVCHKLNAQYDACGSCIGCQTYAHNNHPDVHVLTSDDKNRIGVEAVRHVNRALSLHATCGAYKIVHIPQAENLRQAAQHALLKTLEEPPGATVFMLMTTQPAMLLATVRSRCLRLNLRPQPLGSIHQALQKAGATQALAALLAHASNHQLEVAMRWYEADAQMVLTTLQEALKAPLDTAQVLQAAQPLGAEDLSTQMAMAFLEIWIRDLLAYKASGPNACLLAQTSWPSGLEMCHAAPAAQQLAVWRQHAFVNINRAMALQNVLLTLTGNFTP